VIHDYREEIDGPQSRIEVGGRRILCKGGGGDDGGAAQRAADEKARVDAATNSVNRIFGIGDDTAAAARQTLYDTTRNDTSAYYTKQLEQDRAEAARQIEFAKARAGTAGSSQGINLDSQFQQAYDRGLLEIANKADSSATSMKTSDEQSRLGIIAKILAGMDQSSAVSSAANQLSTNAQTAQQNAQGSRMANVFSDLLSGIQTGQTVAGQNAAKSAYENTLGNYFPTSGTSSTANGTIS